MRCLKPQSEESRVSYCPFRRKKLSFALKYCFFSSKCKFVEISTELSYAVFSHLVLGDLWRNNQTRNWREHVCRAGRLKNSVLSFLGTQQLEREGGNLGAGWSGSKGRHHPLNHRADFLLISFWCLGVLQVSAFVLSSHRALCGICSR